MKKNVIVTAVLLLFSTALSSQVGINTASPTEIMDVNGTARVRELPLNGSANAISTKPDGTKSPTKNQPFTATKTVVVDNNGILGYVNGLPSDPATLNVGETVSRTYTLGYGNGTSNSALDGRKFRLGEYINANGFEPLPVVDGLQIDVLADSKMFYVPIIINTNSISRTISFQSFATQVNQNRTSLNVGINPCPFGPTTFTNPPGGGGNAGNTNAGWLAVDYDNKVYWTTTEAEVLTTNLQVYNSTDQKYRWYEFKWWCWELSGFKRMFVSITRLL